MKKLIFSFTIMAGLLFIACQNSTNAEQKAVTSDETKEAAEATASATVYVVDAGSSVINWEGYKPGKYGHTGFIKVQAGQISMNGEMPVSGNFVIDMASLTDTDLEDPAKKAKLEGHLKSGDFFEVEKYPTGKFVLTGVSKMEGAGDAEYKVTGNLTLKDITKSIEIPATVDAADNKVIIKTPEFIINRTEWNVNYGSGVIGTIQDQLIADDVKLKITLVGNSSEI